jgi:NAD(P)-dependent dehydrogenase (short-subunit alcohol dehydrogenase family)
MCACVNIFQEKILTAKPFSVAGKTALITGGGSGIGQFMAGALAQAGADIIVVGRRRDRLEETISRYGGSCVCLDLAEKGAAGRLAQQVAEQQAMPNIIVNAAGINPRKHADVVTEQEWTESVHLNLNVPFLVAQAFIGQMKAQKWGRIINIASLQSSRAFVNGIAYGAAKGGISQLTRAMAEAWSMDGICANAIAPGFFPTELTQAVFENNELAAQHARNTAIGRNGNLEDLVGPLLFLASDASIYVTGQVLAVDGGYTAK